MKLTFLGTRGNIKSKNEQHKKHTSLLISYKNNNVIIDRGDDWLNEQYNFKINAKENIPRAIITHCGSEIVKGDEKKIRKKLNDIGKQYNVKVQLAYDGMEMILR